MAVNIGGTVFKITADNSDFKRGMKEAESVRSQISARIASFDKREAQDSAKINMLFDKRVAKQRELDEAIKKGESAKAIANLRNELARLATAEEAAVNKSIENNRKRREAYEKLAGQINGKTGGSIGGSLGGLATKAGIVGAALLGLKKGFDVMQKGAAYIDTLNKRADDLGMTVSTLNALTKAANIAGVSNEKLDISLKTLARTSNGNVKKSFIELAEKAEKGTLSLAEAQKAFGENGLEMIRILSQGKEAVSAMFNNTDLDVASAQVMAYKDSWNALCETINNSVLVKGGDILATAYNYWTHDLWTGTSAAAEVNLKKINADAQKFRAIQEAERQKQQAEIEKANKKLEESRRGEMNGLDKVLNLRRELEKSQEKLSEYTEGTADYTKQYNIVVEQTIALDKAEADIKKQQDAYSKSILKSEEARNAKLAESAKLLSDYSFNRLAPEEKISELTKAITADKQKLAEMDKDSTHYANFRNELTKKYIELRKLQDDQAKAEADKKKKEADDAKKKLEAQQKSYQEFLKEHNIQKKIATAKYQGNTALVEQLKKQAEATKLADKYGISLKEAYKILKDQDKIKNINEGKESKYSDKDVEKAKRILKRGESGNVGKRTLEEAQAIVDGKDPEGGFHMATFKNLNKKATTNTKAKYNPYRFSSMSTSSRNVDTQTATTPEQNKDASNQKENVQETFYKNVKEVLGDMKDLLTSIKNETQAAAQSKKH